MLAGAKHKVVEDADTMQRKVSNTDSVCSMDPIHPCGDAIHKGGPKDLSLRTIILLNYFDK